MKKNLIYHCKVLYPEFKILSFKTVMILFLSISPLLGICQDTKKTAPLKFPAYADSTYLMIEGNLWEPENVWKNVDVFVRAGNRLEQHLFVKDGFFTWNIEKGEDIKISENIFQYFLHIWQQSNEKLKTGNYEIRDFKGRKIAVTKTKPQNK